MGRYVDIAVVGSLAVVAGLLPMLFGAQSIRSVLVVGGGSTLLMVLLLKIVGSWEFGVVALSFLVPLDGIAFTGPATTLVKAVFLATVIAFIAQIRHDPLLRNRLTFLMRSMPMRLWLTYAMWSVASALWALSSSRALVRFSTLLGVLGLMTLIGVSGQRTVRRIWVAALSGIVIAVPLAFLFPNNVDLIDNASRFSAGGLDPNDLAVLVVAVLSAVVISRVVGGGGTTTNGVAAAFLILLVLATGSRMGVVLLGVLGFLTVAMTVLSRGERSSRGRSLTVVVISTIVVGLVLVGVVINSDGLVGGLRDTSVDRYSEILSGDASSLVAREERSALAIELITENPVAGVGLGSYNFVAAQRGITSRGGLVAGDVPHNSYLSVASETGIVGISLLLAAVLFTLNYPRLGGRAVDPFVRSMFVALAVVSVAALVLEVQASKVLFMILGSLLAEGLRLRGTATNDR